MKKITKIGFKNFEQGFFQCKYSSTSNGMGFIIAADLDHDKAELSILVRELKMRGYGVFVFDFPSQGSTKGQIPFGYKETPFLAEQFYLAMVIYSQRENIPKQAIHIIGFGDGARAALEASTIVPLNPKNMTLVSPNIKLSSKRDFDVLNYSNDASIGWIKDLNLGSPGLDINIVTTKLNSSSSVRDNQDLVGALNRQPSRQLPEGAAQNKTSMWQAGFVPNIFAMSSGFVVDAILEASIGQHISTLSRFKLLAQFAALISFTIVMRMSTFFIEKPMYSSPIPERKRSAGILKMKLAMHFPSLVVTGVLLALFYVAPIPFPSNIILPVFIGASYGIVMLVMYRLTTFANNLGTSFAAKDGPGKKRHVTLAIAACFIFVMAWKGFSPSTLLPYLWKTIWYVILVLLYMPLFFIDEKERRMFADNPKFCYMLFLTNILPFLVMPLICVAVGLINGVFAVLSMFLSLLVSMSVEFLFRPIGSSSFSCAFTKSCMFVFLSFSNMTLFF
ncbi:MAG: hypothetical protein FWG10_02595 [Eubacteriaceae bacterium]|nr:hypothetical protein [Eubacteriaceae bacterium]